MTKTEGHLYSIKQSGGRRPAFNLERDGKIIAELKFHNERGSRASANLGSKTLNFYRQKGLKKDVNVHVHDPSSFIASFNSDLLSRGMLTINNKTYRWAPANKTQTTWAWYGDNGEEILSIHKRFHLYMENGDVHEYKHLLSEDNVKILTLLGWYLILLGQQDILQHLFVSLEVYLAKRTNKFPQVS